MRSRTQASYVQTYMHTHTHTYMYVHTERYTHWCLRAHTHACATACTTKKNITFRSKKLDVRKVRDVQIYTYVCRHVPNTDIHSYPYTRERMHARKRMQTDRRMDACAHDYIHTYRQTGARRTASAHTRTNAYVRTHVRTYIIHTYLLFV